jgi:hypothetical protein
MTVVTDLPCPSCGRRLDALCWRGDDRGRCRSCMTEYVFQALPALEQAAAAPKAEASVVGQEATCFFHPENRATGVCDGCGRFLCPVCLIDDGQRKLCPRCVSLARKEGSDLSGLGERTLWDSLALTLAAGPLLFYPTTFVSAPVAIGVAIYGWTQPCSAVRKRSWRLTVALVLALIEIAAWVFIIVRIRESAAHRHVKPPPSYPSSVP